MMRRVFLAFAVAVTLASTANASSSGLAVTLRRATAAYTQWITTARDTSGGIAAQARHARALRADLRVAARSTAAFRPTSTPQRTAKSAVAATIAAGLAVADDSLRLQRAALAFRGQGDKPAIMRDGGDAAASLRRDALRFEKLRVRAVRLLSQLG